MHHVILGAGPAGVIAAETLRKHAPGDRITLVGDEAEPPYSRMAIPYLLVGDIDERGTYLRKRADHFAQQRIDRLSARAAGVDVQARTVALEGGVTLGFDRLLIATNYFLDFPALGVWIAFHDASTTQGWPCSLARRV